ncbi:MAG: hypothetical protein ACXQTF_00965 [Candidatus Hecatellaceae archaeon]|nr:MAG: hypothetical protein DRO43_00690 [Candidatus Hecatellales archaeon]
MALKILKLRILDPFKLIIILGIVALAGLSGTVAIFLSVHPYFNPLQQQELPRGWVDPHTYVSPSNFTIHTGETVRDVFSYAGAGGESIIIISTQVISIEKKGEMVIKFNGIEIGSTYVETPGVISTSVASCCFVSLVSAGVDNVVEITSKGYEGTFRYIIKIPTPGE